MTAATLRRLPVPVSEPHPARTLVRRPVSRPGQGELRLRLRPVATASPAAYWADPQPTPTEQLPDARATVHQLVQAVVEVLGGSRPAGQLVRWLTADVHAGLHRRAALAARVRQAGPAGPGRRPVVRGVRVCRPADGVVEASAVVLDDGRVRAVALRLEGLDGRWRTTALEVG